VIVGDAGVGKSAVLERAIAEAEGRGFATFFFAGTAARSAVPFSGLHAIVRCHANLLPQLVAFDRTALERAREGRPDATDTGAVAGALVALAHAVAPARPLLFAIDDMHRLDRHSMESLSEIGRIAFDDRLRILATTRDVHF
jgi:hypothetical protein